MSIMMQAGFTGLIRSWQQVGGMGGARQQVRRWAVGLKAPRGRSPAQTQLGWVLLVLLGALSTKIGSVGTIPDI